MVIGLQVIWPYGFGTVTRNRDAASWNFCREYLQALLT